MSSAGRGVTGGIVLLALLAAGGWWIGTRWETPHLDVAPRAPAAATGAKLTGVAEPVHAESLDDGSSGVPSATRAVAARAQTEEDAADESRVNGSSVPRPPLQSVAIHVIDGESRIELRGVELFHAGPCTLVGPRVPAFSESDRCASGDAPLTVMPPTDGYRVGVIVARAAGYALGCAPVDWGSGGERVIALLPGGALDLTVHGAPAGAELTAQLFEVERTLRRISKEFQQVRSRRDYSAGDTVAQLLESLRGAVPVEARPVGILGLGSSDRLVHIEADHAIHCSGLRPGEWLVLIRSEPERDVVGRGRVTIDPAETAALEIDWREPSVLPKAPASGRIRLDRGWLLSDGQSPVSCMQLFLGEWIDESAGGHHFTDEELSLRPTEVPGELRFDAGLLAPGSYQARLEPLHFAGWLQVPPEGDRELLLEVPPPADVTITFRDEQNGETIHGLWLDWLMSDDRTAASTSFPPRVITHDPGDGRFTLRSPTGVFALHYGRDRHQLVHEVQLRVAPGSNEFTVPYHPTSKISIRLRDGVAIVPCEPELDVTVRGAFGRNEPLSRFTVDLDPETTYLFDVVGPALLEVRDVDGFRPSEPIAVELIDGETITVEIPLERDPTGAR